MGLLDKIKDLFTDEIEEEEEIGIEEDKNTYEPPQNVLPKVMRENIKEKEKEKFEFTSKFKLNDNDNDNDNDNGNDIVRSEANPTPKKEIVIEKKETNSKSFTFPIDFENDYVPKRNANQNVLNVEKNKKNEERKSPELYSKKYNEKNKFKVSPVISPVYGVLDKNYKKEEVKEREELEHTMKRPSKTVDFETVRKKAFGNLTDDIKDNLLCEDCELYKEAKRINSLKEGDLLYDLTQEKEKDEKFTIKEAYDNYEEFGVTYEKKHEEKYEEKHEKEVDIPTEIINHTDEETIAEEIKFTNPEEDTLQGKNITTSINEYESEKKPIPSRENKKKEEKVDEDFFDLIDSMYKERIDE